MVDFSLLNKVSSKSRSRSLLDTFSRLDRKVSHVELRASQVELFRKIDERIDDQDLVLKLTTGGGKTATGLIYLRQKMDQYEEPVVFLVPTTQLAEQVIDEGGRLGIPVVNWPSKSKYPPDEALRCAAVMVCTYDKFFNGKSTFARADVRLIPCALVLDDVHAGIEALRKTFSAELSDECRAALILIVNDAMRKYEPANWLRVENSDPAAIVEVPHWVLSDNESAIRNALTAYSEELPLVFAWPYLSREVKLCRLVISGEKAAISMDPPLIGFVDHYVGAKHRLFMSASVHDGASLVRELGCSEAAAAKPIEVDGEIPVGERMVLVPTLIDPEFGREAVLAVVKRVLFDANVVVLVSSEAAAKFWTAGGAAMALGDSFSDSVAKLKSVSKGVFVVFVNRYDGIDLPDAACRLLVIDGLPAGDGILDRLDTENAGGIVGMRGKVANRVEQGLGRAVRSNSDYCAVILSGEDLAAFVSRRVVLSSFSPPTVRQIDIGREISKAISNEKDKVLGLVATIGQVLSRDEGWRTYYHAQMGVQRGVESEISGEASLRRSVAVAERAAADLAMTTKYDQAARELKKAAGMLLSDRYRRGVIKQASAKIQYQVDKVGSLELQSSAYADNCNISRPPVMPPVARRRASAQAEIICEWLRSFADMNGAVVALDTLSAEIRFSNGSVAVEVAMEKLGNYLGADSSRPEREYGRGPDNLWTFGEKAFCIEMKSDKIAKLWKDDAGQIALSEKWVRDNNAALVDVYPLIGSDVAIAERAGDFSDSVRIFDQDAIQEIISNLRAMLVTVIAQGPLFASEAANLQSYLGTHAILPQQILQKALKIRDRE